MKSNHDRWRRTIGIGAFRTDLTSLGHRLESELESEFPKRNWAVQLDMRRMPGDEMTWRVDIPIGETAAHGYLAKVLSDNVTPVYQALFDSIDPPPEGCDNGREFIVRVWATDGNVITGSRD